MEPAEDDAAAAGGEASSDEEMEPAAAAAAPADADDFAGKLSDEEVEVPPAPAAWATPAPGRAPQEAPAADGSAATTTPAPGHGPAPTRKHKRVEIDEVEDGGAAGGWEGGWGDDAFGDDDFGAFTDEGPSRLRLQGLQTAPKCAGCSREITDPSLAARATAAQAEQQRKVQTLQTELADAKKRIEDLEAIVLRIQG